MSKKIPVDELLRLACIYAERDQQEFLVSYSRMPDDPAALEAAAFIKQIRDYRKKRWGKTKLESWIETATPLTLAEIQDRKK